MSARTALLVGLGALSLGLPVGLAMGQGEPEGLQPIPADQCPDAQEVFEEAGVEFDYFIPECPTAAEAEAQLEPEPVTQSGIEACQNALEEVEHPACEAYLEAAEEQGEL